MIDEIQIARTLDQSDSYVMSFLIMISSLKRVVWILSFNRWARPVQTDGVVVSPFPAFSKSILQDYSTCSKPASPCFPHHPTIDWAIEIQKLCWVYFPTDIIVASCYRLFFLRFQSFPFVHLTSATSNTIHTLILKFLLSVSCSTGWDCAMFKLFSGQTYEQVSQDKTEDQIHVEISSENSNPNHHRTPIAKRTKYIVFGLIAAVFIVFVPTAFLIHSVQSSPWTSCGDNPTTARERGCSFDLISFAWQMPECYDSSLVEEFANWETWTFWMDENGTTTVPQEVARLGERTLWMKWHYHIVHCTFVWRQLHRAYEAGWIDSDLRSYKHTTHCQRMLLMDGIEVDDGRFFSISNDTVITSANIIYPVCEKVGKLSSGSSWWDSIPPRQWTQRQSRMDRTEHNDSVNQYAKDGWVCMGSLPSFFPVISSIANENTLSPVVSTAHVYCQIIPRIMSLVGPFWMLLKRGSIDKVARNRK